MNSARVITVILTMLAVSGSKEIGAQTTSVEPLSLPLNGELVCQAIPDREGVILEFTDSAKSFRRRESTLSYDTFGNPLHMVVSAEGRSAEGKPVVHLVVVRFLPTAEGAIASFNGYDPNFQLPLLRPEDTVEKLPPGWKKATASELKKARCLALDFWKRRCGNPTGPTQTD